MGPLNQDWEVRSLDDLELNGLQLVSDFFNEQFPGVFYPKCTPEIFKWKLGSSNPAGLGFLTVAMCNGLVIGVASGTRKILRENNETFSAIEIGDTFTHPDFRKNGKCITSMSQNASNDKYFTVSVFGRLVSETISRAQLSGTCFIYGTPNENSKPPYLKRLNFTEIDQGNIYSNVIITPRFVPLQKIRWVLSFSDLLIRLFIRALSYMVLGRNSIHEISDTEFLANFREEYYCSEYLQNRIYLVRSPQILQHRYTMHPNHHYRFFQVSVKGVTKGVLITTEVLRSSGVSSFVVSDWLFSDRKIEKRIALLISKLRSHNQESETISFWDFGVPSKITKFYLGIILHKKVSVISKDSRTTSAVNSTEFGDFRMGWSDNG